MSVIPSLGYSFLLLGTREACWVCYISLPVPVSLLGNVLSVPGLIEDYARFFSSGLKVE